MDEHQVAKKIEWLDDQRNKDRKVFSVLEDQVSDNQETSLNSARRLEKIDSDLTEFRALVLSRIEHLENVFSSIPEEINRIADAQTRQSESARESSRVVLIEQEGLSHAVSDLRKSAELVPRLLEEMKARKDEENRLSRTAHTLERKIESALEAINDREQTIIKVQEGYRKDAKRLTDIQTDMTDVRRRSDEHNGKLAVIEDITGRTERRVSELAALENDRRLSQNTWIEQQTIALAERDRKWEEIQTESNSFNTRTDEYAENMRAYQDTHREMVKALDTFYENLERSDRRISETMEVQRLSEEHFRQDWNAFLADDQKKWTTHMLLRDEQWRENERQVGKVLERLSGVEADIADIEEALRDKHYSEQARMQALYNWVRESMAEFDESLTKVR